MNKKRKAQVAMEFIMTYGWALLIISLVLGVFVYMQITPTQLVSPSCAFTEDIYCIAHTVSTNTLTMEIKNNARNSIDITQGTCTYEGSESAISGTTIPSGDTVLITCNYGPAPMNELVNINVLIYYIPEGFVYEKSTEGNIIGYVV